MLSFDFLIDLYYRFEHAKQLRELKLAQEEVSHLTEEMRAMSDGSGALRNEHQRLQEEFNRREKEKAEGEEGGGGIGQGG